MFSTTTLIAIQIVSVKHLPIVLAVAFFVLFGFFDGKSGPNFPAHRHHLKAMILGLFWGAALKKVPQGAWVPLVIGVVLCVYWVMRKLSF